MANFCFEDGAQTLKKLKTSKDGLSVEEAQTRLSENGVNALDSGKSMGLLGLFFSQFKDFMTILLIVAAAVSGLIAFLS